METIDVLKYKEYAYRYFSGKLPAEYEEELYTFLSSDPSNENLFRQWEKEWISDQKTDYEVQKAYLDVKHKIRVKALQERVRHFRTGMVAAISAAVLFLGVFTYFSIRTLDEQKDEVYFTCTAPLGEKSYISLPDGTQVWLNSGSTLTYGSNFLKKDRVVSMTGECFFDVKKIDGMNFLVKTPDDCNITVKGTRFNVSAYEEDNIVSTSLVEGIVEVNYDNTSFTLAPGENYVLDLNTGTFNKRKINIAEVDTWKNGQIQYEHISLDELLVKLSRNYNVTFDVSALKQETLQKCFRISMRNNETLDQILSALRSIVGISIQEKEGVYYFS